MKKFYAYMWLLALLMTGVQGFAQQIAVAPDSLWIVVGAGDSVKRTITIQNVDLSNVLNWRIVTNSESSPSFSAYRESAISPRAGFSFFTSNFSVTSSKVLVLISSSTGGSVNRALNELQVPFDSINIPLDSIDARNLITGIDYSNYHTIFVSLNGAYVDERSIEALANAALSGKTLFIMGGTDYSRYYDGVNNFLLSHNNIHGWNISNTPHFSIADPSNRLAYNLPGTYNFENPQTAFYSLRITDPLASTVAVNGDGYPALVEKRIGSGRLIYFLSPGDNYYWGSSNDFDVLKIIIRNSLQPFWLTVNPHEGSVAANSSVQVGVTIDGSFLYPGDYEASIKIYSNDMNPADTIITLPVKVTVLPPQMSVTPDTSFDIECALGDTTDLALSINNIGGQGRLFWYGSIMESSGLPVQLLPSSGNIAQNGMGEFLIKLLPAYIPGSYDVKVKIVSNDPANPTDLVSIHATVLPPEINVSTEAIVKRVEKNGNASATLSINNNGSGKLFWNLSLQNNVPHQQTIQIHRNVHKGFNSNRQTQKGSFDKLLPSSQTFSTQTYDLIPGSFDELASAEDILTCFTADPQTGLIYTQEDHGYRFYQYDPTTNSWIALANAPIFSGENGSAVVLNGKVYTSYVWQNVIGIYDIASNTWTYMDSPVSSGLLEAFGGKIYQADQYLFVNYDPVTTLWDTLPHPGEINLNFYYENNWGGLRYYNGYMYDLAGDGDTTFAKFNLMTEEWTMLPAPPRGVVLGTAVDPGNHMLYAAGNYGDDGDSSLFAFNFLTEQWGVVSGMPFSFVSDMGMAYVSNGEYRGLYLIEGENGAGFVRYNTASGIDWLSANAYSGTINGNSSANVMLNFMPDTLALGDYTANLYLSSNDNGNPLFAVPVTMQVIADGTGPVTGISFFQDKYLSQYIDVIATADEPLSGQPLIKVTKPNASQETLTTITVDAAKQVYYGHFKLDASGNYSFTVTSKDTASNLKDSVRTLAAALAKPGDNITLNSVDGVTMMKIADNTMKSDAYLTVTAEGIETYSSEGVYSLTEAYSFGPFGMDLNESVAITFDYSKLDGVDENHLTIYRRTKDGLEMMKTTVNKTTKTASTTTMKMGKYQLFYNANVASEIEGALPKEFALFQNYPNPFNPTTTIRYALPKETRAIVTVYNVLGQKVKTLVNEVQESGVKSVLWDGKNDAGQSVSSGIYFYKIQTKEFTATRKMLFVK